MASNTAPNGNPSDKNRLPVNPSKNGNTEERAEERAEEKPDSPATVQDANPNADALDIETRQDKSLADKLRSGEFSDTDADDDPDQRGWIMGAGTDGKSHRVPVQYWERYSRIHNL